MQIDARRQIRTIKRLGRVAAMLALAGAGIGVLSGCETDSFIDPSVLGRWEKTPVIMPVLDRLSAIEDEPTEYVQSSPPTAGDLIPEVDNYRFAAGDQVEIRIRDFYLPGQEEPFERAIDQRGFIELPLLPPVRAQGKTTIELAEAIAKAVQDKQIRDRPTVTVNPRSQRRQTFSILGAVTTPGTFFVPAPDYRLLDAVGVAGPFNESLPFLYVIRQVPLSDEAAGKVPLPEPTRKRGFGTSTNQPRPEDADPAKGEDLLKLIDDLSQPKKSEPSPGLSGSADMMNEPVGGAPAIDLPDSSRVSASAGGGWVFANGQWVKAGEGGSMGASEGQNLVTQRVIKVPIAPLLAGAADVNIVVRAGDVIRFPVPRGGLVYMTGQVARPGPYSLPSDGKLTLLRAFDTAGGLSGIAIPERVDITRVVGEGRQATIRVDARAIAEGTAPDIVLKPDDRVNVGTNFWATPLAVIRGGFRASYGFGFILDRNFEGEVFGPRAGIRNF
ncbi:MAG: polysaccharide biosynthesis/export family protein [Phycisphaerales bacterium]|nr:polysaccharide biosynthesis/export family protein [Phycisphaerales bacterium]